MSLQNLSTTSPTVDSPNRRFSSNLLKKGKKQQSVSQKQEEKITTTTTKLTDPRNRRMPCIEAHKLFFGETKFF